MGKLNNKKFELSDKSVPLVCDGEIKKVYRIRALKDFGFIEAGDLGGCVEKEENLSQDGDSWIFPSSVVIGDAKVQDDAILRSYCLACGNAVVKDEAQLDNYSTVYGNATVGGKTSMLNSNVGGNAVVKGDFKLSFDIRIDGNAKLIFDMPSSGPYSFDGPLYIGGDASVRSYYDMILIGPFSTLNNSKITIHKDSVRGTAISVGSFTYGLDEFCDQNLKEADFNIPEKVRKALAEIARWAFG